MALLLGLLLGMGQMAQAGLSEDRRYYGFTIATGGEIGRALIVAVTKDEWTYVRIDYDRRVIDVTSGTHVNGWGSDVSIGAGLTVSLSPSADGESVIIAEAGTRWNVPRLRLAVGTDRDGYSGTIFWNGGLSNGTTSTAIYIPIEKGDFAMVLINDNGTVDGGIGFVDGGRATLRLVSGNRVNFPVRPDGRLVQGQATFLGSGSNAFYLSLVRVGGSRLANISTRGWIGGNGINLIGGFVITDGTKVVLIRAVGPELANLGVGTAHPDPRITLFEGQTALASNDDWFGTDVPLAGLDVGAFPLSPNGYDAAMVQALEPGNYTVVVEGDGDPGEVLMEVYEIR